MESIIDKYTQLALECNAEIQSSIKSKEAANVQQVFNELLALVKFKLSICLTIQGIQSLYWQN